MALVNFIGANPDSVAWEQKAGDAWNAVNQNGVSTDANGQYIEAYDGPKDASGRPVVGSTGNYVKTYYRIANGIGNIPKLVRGAGPDDVNPFLTAISTSIAPNTPAATYNTTIAPPLPVVLPLPYVAPPPPEDPRIAVLFAIDQYLLAGGTTYRTLAIALGNTKGIFLPYPELYTEAALRARAKLMGITAMDDYERAFVWQGPSGITTADPDTGLQVPITLANISTPPPPAAPPLELPFYIPGGDAVDPGIFGSSFGSSSGGGSTGAAGSSSTAAASLAPTLNKKTLAIAAGIVGLLFVLNHKAA